ISCAVTNPYGDKLSAWASYVALNYTRLPGTPAKDAAHFGVSYARSLFEEHGLFREDVVAGEDTEFNNKIRASTEFRWTPSVRNAHRHPRSFRAYFFDQFKRGRRTAAAYRGIDRTLTKFQIA